MRTLAYSHQPRYTKLDEPAIRVFQMTSLTPVRSSLAAVGRAQVSAVPEPETLALILTGLACIVALRRRRA